MKSRPGPGTWKEKRGFLAGAGVAVPCLCGDKESNLCSRPVRLTRSASRLIVLLSTMLMLGAGLDSAVAQSSPAGQGQGGTPAWVQSMSANRGQAKMIGAANGVDWCQTLPSFLRRHPGLAGTLADCPTYGGCDVPGTRDAWTPDPSTPILWVRVKFNIFCNDDGSNPAASLADAVAQMEQLNADYQPWRIQFTYQTELINSSQFRSFADSEEWAMKTTYADQPAQQLNVYVVHIEGGYLGVATFPWDPDATGALGGVIVDDDWFGVGQKTLTHEFGHCFGLWHTHHGVSEVVQCSVCYERADGQNGDTTGDRCSDTDPSPVNFSCAPPGGIDPCSSVEWGETDYHNYMGYADDACYEEFSLQQAGRAHCWINAELTGWLEGGGSSVQLSVQSVPITNVTIAATPVDAGGQTDYVRLLDAGSAVTLTAPEVSDCREFVRWYLDDVEQPVGQRSLSVTMNSNHAAMAQYQLTGCTLAVEIQGQGTVTAEPAGVVFEAPGGSQECGCGMSLQLWADPADGWYFARWEGDLSGEDNPAEVTLDGYTAVTAVFAHAAGDQCPTLQSLPDQVLAEGAVATEQAMGSDPDPDDTLSYSMGNNPSFVTVEEDTGLITMSPAVGDAGVYSDIEVCVADDAVPPCSDCVAFQLTVVEAGALVAEAGPGDTKQLGECVTLQGSASGGQPPYTYAWWPQTGLSDPTAAQPVACPDVTTTYTLTVTDDLAAQATDTVKVTIVSDDGGSGGCGGGAGMGSMGLCWFGCLAWLVVQTRRSSRGSG